MSTDEVDLTIVMTRGEIECKRLSVGDAQRLVNVIREGISRTGATAITLHVARTDQQPTLINAHHVVSLVLPPGVS